MPLSPVLPLFRKVPAEEAVQNGRKLSGLSAQLEDFSEIRGIFYTVFLFSKWRVVDDIIYIHIYYIFVMGFLGMSQNFEGHTNHSFLVYEGIMKDDQ